MEGGRGGSLAWVEGGLGGRVGGSRLSLGGGGAVLLGGRGVGPWSRLPSFHVNTNPWY